MTEISHPRFAALRPTVAAVVYISALAILFWYGQATTPPELERTPLPAPIYVGSVLAALCLSLATYVATKRWHASRLDLISRFTTWLLPALFVAAALLAHRYGTKLFWLVLIISQGCNLARFCAMPQSRTSTPGETA